MTVSLHKQKLWHPASDRPWPVTLVSPVVSEPYSDIEPAPEPDENEIVFLNRRFSRHPRGKELLAFIGGMWAVLAITFSAIDRPVSGGPPAPVVKTAPLFWPANSNPKAMCKNDGGPTQILAAGGATKRHPLPPGSSVMCADGAQISVVVG
jgi:hypothetical protein